MLTHMFNKGVTILMLCLLVLSSCQKFLDVKYDKTSVTITKLSELQALLDNFSFNDHMTLEADGADDYYALSGDIMAINSYWREIYKWEDNGLNQAWGTIYKTISTCNVVLDEVNEAQGTKADRDRIKGHALFERAYQFFRIAELYCKPYNSTTAAIDHGAVLRTSPDIESKFERASVKETYDKILSDLAEAANLLPDVGAEVSRPEKRSAYGLMARVYLAMREYPKAGEFADKYLKIDDSLFDYNIPDPLILSPFTYQNPELSFYAKGTGLSNNIVLRVDSTLYDSYDPNDMRKQLLFAETDDGSYRFKGNYSTIEGYLFCGVATNEMFLIRAESFARADQKTLAMDDLNNLLEKRFKTGTFIPLTAASQAEALTHILRERRKELVYSSARWSDLRRLNLEGFNITLTRKIENEAVTLAPNSKRWLWLIPNLAMTYNDWPQNER